MNRGLALLGGCLLAAAIFVQYLAIIGNENYVWFVAPFIGSFLAGVCIGGAKSGDVELTAFGGFLAAGSACILLWFYLTLPHIYVEGIRLTLLACVLVFIAMLMIEKGGKRY